MWLLKFFLALAPDTFACIPGAQSSLVENADHNENFLVFMVWNKIGTHDPENEKRLSAHVVHRLTNNIP